MPRPGPEESKKGQGDLPISRPLNRNEAAELLGVSVDHLERLRSTGALPKGVVYTLPSGRGKRPTYRYDRAKLQQFLERCAQ